MANRNNQHIDSPSLKELAYRALKNITPAQKESFTPNEIQYFESEYTLQKFCQEERIDRILYFMAKVGFDYTIRVHKNVFEVDMVEFATQYQASYPQHRVDAIEATKRENVCIVSSRDVMFLSNLVAQNCTTKVYDISEFSKDLAKKGKTIGQLRKWENEVKHTAEAYEFLNDILLEQMNAKDYAGATLGLQTDDLRVLCALYKKRQSAVSMSEISKLAKSKGAKMYFRKNMEKLMREGLITSDQKETKKLWANSSFFMITTKGIGKIMEYQKYVYKNAFGA